MPLKNPYRGARFVQSAPDLARCPPEQGAEVAFAGRSNAGKSSAINTLTGNPKLARTSKTPGRTQLINYFQIDDERALVDLPGYGYAKVPMAIKKQWDRHLSTYLQQRQSLRGLILLMDIRHPLQTFDATMLNWAVAGNMPVHILLTKADKLKKGPANNTRLAVQQHLIAANVADQVSVQCFSARKKEGVDTLVSVLNHMLMVPED